MKIVTFTASMVAIRSFAVLHVYERTLIAMMTIGKDNGFAFDIVNEFLDYFSILDHRQNIAHTLVILRFVDGSADGFIHVFLQFKRCIGEEPMCRAYVQLGFF